MSNWHAFPKRSWSTVGGALSGFGAGEGSYGLSYAIETGMAPFLNGRVSAQLRIANRRRASGGGVVCRADAYRTFVAFYVVTDPDLPDQFVVRLAAFKYGRIVASASLRKPISLANGEIHLSLQFFSGELIGELMSADANASISYLVPEVPFRGHAGVVRFYDAPVFVKHIQQEELRMKPVLPEEADRQPAEAYPFQVFMSYAHDDLAVVRKVAEQFRVSGISYWMDEDQITFGDRIIEKIEEGLRNSRYVVACLSENQARSGWCRAEYGQILFREFGGETSRRVIPLKLDSSSKATSVPLLLSDKMRADFTNPDSFAAFLAFLKQDPEQARS